MNGVTNLWLTIRACADLFLWGAIALLFVATITQSKKNEHTINITRGYRDAHRTR